jgi:LPS-assembly protein
VNFTLGRERYGGEVVRRAHGLRLPRARPWRLRHRLPLGVAGAIVGLLAATLAGAQEPSAPGAPAAAAAAAERLLAGDVLAPLSCGASGLGLAAAAEAPAAAPAPDSETPVLRADHLLAAPHVRGRTVAAGPVYARADTVGGEMDVETTFEGNVEIRHDGLVLRAERAVYGFEDDQLRARGKVHLVQTGAVFDGPALDLKLEAESGQMPQASYAFPTRNGSGQSRLIEFLSQDNIRMNQATYTTCDPSSPAWWLRSDRMDIHEADQEAETNGSVLYFQDLPVFAWPWYFDFPLGNDRRSGFLTPGFSQSSEVGPMFSFPYYVNIAPNRDYTATANYLPQRGAKLDNEFRFLEPHVRGLFEYDVLPGDHVTGTTRESLAVLTQYDDAIAWKAGLNYARVSDDTYFTDFSRNVVSASTEVLPQEAYLSYTQPYWNSSLRLSKSQTLISLLAVNDPGPYERVPDFQINLTRPDYHGFDLGGTFDVTRFQHPAVNPCFEPPDATFVPGLPLVSNIPGCYEVNPALPFTQRWFSQDGSRLILNPTLSYPLLAPGYFVVPKVQWHYTSYALDPTFNNGLTSVTRSLPIASIDSGLIFERPVSWLGMDSRQTLEPRLFYALVPYRNQNTLPNFDSADADFNFAQLFTENTFTGSDRIAQANQITGAITTRIIDDATGAERLRLALGERYYFGPQTVTLPGDIPRTSKASDTLFLASASLDRTWSVDTVFDYNYQTSALAVVTVGMRYQPVPSSVLNLSYRYEIASLAGTTIPINQPQFSAQWPLSHRWYGVGAVNYSVSDRALAQAVAGFEYKADCWVARIAMSRYAVTLPNSAVLSNNYTSSYFLQIEFNGLSSVGFNPLDTLQSNIPGYQRVNPPPLNGGPFDRYE